MNLYEKLHWRFWGAVANQVAEIEDTFDAVAFPILAAFLTGLVWLGSITLYQGGSTVEFVLAAFGGLIAAVLTVFTIVLVVATAVYARQRTELPVVSGVDDGR